MHISQVLFSQGFGSRRDCAGLLQRGEVQVNGQVVTDPHADFDPATLQFTVQGGVWPYCKQALVMLHKPVGYECSRKPRHHPAVLSLLPLPLQHRGVQPVGRLDEDTTGLLLLTDDGALIHRLTSPKHHVPKVYEVGTKHPVDATQAARLLAGVVLDDDPAPVRAEGCEQTGENTLRLTLVLGKYHQVKRMVAAVGNRVETLHRSSFGTVALPATLLPGQWCWLPSNTEF